MTAKGSHTWDLNLHYHRCHKCGHIFEDRQSFEYRLGSYQKDLECPRCKNHFTVTKIMKQRPAPFFGEGHGAEITWE